jgi:hypothetical protein
VIGSYYSDRTFDFGPETKQYEALERLAESNALLVPVPDDSSDSEYLLLQRYALVLFYLQTKGDKWNNGKWLLNEPKYTTCDWSGITCSDDKATGLNRTYSTVKTEPVICHMRKTLTAVLFSKRVWQQPCRKPSCGNWISDDNERFGFV